MQAWWMLGWAAFVPKHLLSKSNSFALCLAAPSPKTVVFLFGAAVVVDALVVFLQSVHLLSDTAASMRALIILLAVI